MFSCEWVHVNGRSSMKRLITCATLAGLVVGPDLGADLQNQIDTYNREVDLGQSVLGATVGTFERTVAKLIAGGDGSIKVEHMTWAFCHMKTEQPFPSSVEMVSGFNILVKDGVVSLQHSTNKLPVSYVRIVDPAATNIVCNVEVLGSMAGLGGTNSAKMSSLWLRYVYNGGWKEDEGARRVVELR